MNKCVRLGDNRRRWKKGRRGRGGSAGPLTSDANRLQAIVAGREEGVNGLIYRSPRLTNFFCCLPRWEALCEERWPLSLSAILKRASTLSMVELPSFLNAKLQLDKKRLSVSAALLHDCNSRRRRRRQNEKCPGTKLGLFLPSLPFFLPFDPSDTRAFFPAELVSASSTFLSPTKLPRAPHISEFFAGIVATLLNWRA